MYHQELSVEDGRYDRKEKEMKVTITWVQGLKALITLIAFSIFGYGACIHDIAWLYVAITFYAIFVVVDTILINRKQ